MLEIRVNASVNVPRFKITSTCPLRPQIPHPPEYRGTAPDPPAPRIHMMITLNNITSYHTQCDGFLSIPPWHAEEIFMVNYRLFAVQIDSARACEQLVPTPVPCIGDEVNSMQRVRNARLVWGENWIRASRSPRDPKDECVTGRRWKCHGLRVMPLFQTWGFCHQRGLL